MSRLHLLVLITAFAVILTCPTAALAIDVPIGFGQGTLPNGVSPLAAQSAALSTDVSGTFHADGSGSVWNAKAKALQPFVFTSPLDHAVEAWDGPVNWKSNPVTSPYPTSGSTLGLLPGQLVSVEGLSLDLSHVANPGMSFETLETTTDSEVLVFKRMDVDFGGYISQLGFVQTGAASLAGSGGHGTFAVPGTLTTTLTDWQYFLAGFLTAPLNDQVLSVPLILSGNWSVTGTATNTQVVLDTSGNAVLSWNDAWSTFIDVSDPFLLKLSTTNSLQASLLQSFDVHLTQSNISLGESSSSVSSGAQVAVDLLGGVSATGGLSATFDAITNPGTFTVETMALQPGADPSTLGIPAFTFGTPESVLQVWKIDFTGEFTGQTLLTFNYVDELLPVGTDPASLAVMHFADGQWHQLPTVNLDVDHHLITVTTDSFSPFALAVVPEPASWLLAGLGGLGLACAQYRARRRACQARI